MNTDGHRFNLPQKTAKSAKHVAPVSKPAVSPTSESARRTTAGGSQVWKPAIQQTWKSALRPSLPSPRSLRSLAASCSLLPPDELHEIRHAQHARQLRRRVGR